MLKNIYHLKNNKINYVEFNLFDNDLAKEAFDTSKNAKELLLRISALSKVPLVENETIIFIDEIQFASEVVTKIRFLIEEGLIYLGKK